MIGILIIPKNLHSQSFDIEQQNANITCVGNGVGGWEFLDINMSVLILGSCVNSYDYDSTCHLGIPVFVRYNVPGCNPIVFTVNAVTGVPANISCYCGHPLPATFQFSALRTAGKGNCTYTIQLQY